MKSVPFPGTVFVLAALVVVVAGMKAASGLLVPFMLSTFVTILLVPLLKWLIAKKIPPTFAFFLVIFFVFGIFVGMTGFLSTHLADLFAHAEDWQAAMTDNLDRWMEWLQSKGIDVDRNLLMATLQPQKLFAFTLSLVKNTSVLLSNSLLIFLTIVFMLAESFVIKKKIAYVERVSGIEGLSHRIDIFTDRLNHYFTLKAFTSALTGIWIVVVLSWFDVPYPLLWGIGGFLLNFIPVIGSIIAAIPPVLLSLATHGYVDAFWVAGWFVVINVVVGNLLEPRIMGRGLELSELIVFVSLVFWGWVFGKVGMLLAVPLTMVVKFALETDERTRWIAIMLSNRVPNDEKS